MDVALKIAMFMSSKKLKSAIKEFQEQGLELNLRPKTIRNRRDFLKRLLGFLSGKPLNFENARAYVNHLRKLGWQPSSINVETKQLRALINFLFKRKYVLENFARDLVLAKVHKKQIDLIDPEVIEKIIVAGTKITQFDTTDKHREIKEDMRIALRFMLRTGLRVSELCQLKGSDFRLMDNPPNFTVVSKGGNEDILPVPRDMIKDLKPRLENKRVFKVRPEGLNRALQRGAKKLEIKQRVHCHLLRHIFCSALLREGVAIAKVKRLMRHSTLKYTDDTYSHYTLTDLDTALNAFPIIRIRLQPEEVLDFVEKAVKERIKKDKRFKLTVSRIEKSLIIKVIQMS